MSDTKIAPEILELIRRTSTVKGCRNVYSLAPRGSRIGFYFQQRRATLLAAVLLERLKKENLRNAEIAVIGAGITGVTFFASLIHYGATKVHLYEASDKMCTTGDTASHRLLHPNYNRWPMLGSMDPFTSLPVLNWRAGPANEVIEGLRQSVDCEETETVWNDRFHSNHKCVEVSEVSSGHGKPVKVSFQDKSDKRFQIVVLAVGFAKESCHNWDLIDYWTEEETPIEKDSHQRPTEVFGTGDGALIDIFRCCAKDPEAAWEIPLGLIGRLRGSEAYVLRKDAVDLSPAREVPFSDREIQIQRHEEEMRSVSWDILKSMNLDSVNEYVKQEKRFYEDFVKDMLEDERSIAEFLDSKFKPVSDGKLKPKLIGEFSCPYEPTSAPINKLLLAYLIVTKRIQYRKKSRGQIAEILDVLKKKSAGEARKTISICRFGARRNFPSSPDTPIALATEADSSSSEIGNGGPVTLPAGLKVTTRQTNSEICSKTDALEGQLIDVLSGVSGGEFVLYDAIPHYLNVRQNEGSDSDIADSTREKFKPILQRFAEKYLEKGQVEHIRTKPDSPARWIVRTSMKHDDLKKSLREIGGIDGIFCGAPIVLGNEVNPDGEDC